MTLDTIQHKDFLIKILRDIFSGLGELLNEKQKVWVKANLKKETVFLLGLLLNKEV